MKLLRVSQEQAQQIAAKLPAGKTIADIRLMRCAAQILSADEVSPADDAEVSALLASVNLAGAPPLLTNGKPTIMRVVAWMLHEGVNTNRLEFLAEDLGPTADAIRAPNLLPMDFNHSAFRPLSPYPKAIGVWYKAEKRWDPNAKDGKGAYGIIAEGLIWSWLFPDESTELLAEQQRNGRIDFSMACIPTSATLAQDENGPKEIVHQPVLLTNSALDVPPADIDAVGIGVEGSDDPTLETTLIQRLSSPTHTTTLTTMPKAAAAMPSDQLTEVQMEELQAQIAALTAQLTEATAQITALTATQESLAAAEARVVALTADLATAQQALVEAETVREALVAESATTATAMEALRTELAAATAQLTEINEASAAAERTAAYETRLAALPETYRTALSKRTDDEQARFASKWTAASDDEWNEFATELQFAFQNVRLSYQDRSQAEGGALPNGGNDAADDMAAAIATIKR